MKTVQEAVEHYFPKKKNGEMSIGDIRSEIKERHDFRDEHVKEICRQISELEFAELKAEKKPTFSFLDHIGFSYFMVLTSSVIIVVCIFNLYQRSTNEPDPNAGQFDAIAPYAFILGALALTGKHLVRIKRRRKNNL